VHLFLRPIGMPSSVQPVVPPRRLRKTQGRGEAHLVAISLDNRGLPIGVFTTPWSFYPAADVCAMIDRYTAGLAAPTNRWLAAVVRLFRIQIEDVVHRRDSALASWRKRHPGVDPARTIQVVTRRRLSLTAQIVDARRDLERARRARRARGTRSASAR
jgi:hypothetical protein